MYEHGSAVKVHIELANDYVIKKERLKQNRRYILEPKWNLCTRVTILMYGIKIGLKKVLYKKMDEFSERESGKALKRILYLEVQLKRNY